MTIISGHRYVEFLIEFYIQNVYQNILDVEFIVPLCNGSISSFDVESVGSNPTGTTKIWVRSVSGQAHQTFNL